MFGPQVERYESYFLQQTREACRSALSLVDRIDHYFAAQVLEASYLLRMGRLQEAYVLSSSMCISSFSRVLLATLYSTAPFRSRMRTPQHI